jgi:hypothetical protein
MFNENAEMFYIKNLKAPVLFAKAQILKKMNQRNDYDMFIVAKE